MGTIDDQMEATSMKWSHVHFHSPCASNNIIEVVSRASGGPLPSPQKAIELKRRYSKATRTVNLPLPTMGL